jgi:hypothetical protein
MSGSTARGWTDKWKKPAMPNFTDLTGLSGIASAAAAMLLRFPGIAKLAKLRLAILLGAVFVLMLIPFGEIPLAAYLRGLTGDLSITTLILLWCAMLRPWFVCIEAGYKHRIALLVLITLSAITLYPMALGAGAHDPYRLGYGDPMFAAVLLLVALIAWLGKFVLITMCIALATLAWAVGWYESHNLWDYLIDPFLAIYASAVITIFCVKSLFRSRQNNLD